MPKTEYIKRILQGRKMRKNRRKYPRKRWMKTRCRGVDRLVIKCKGPKTIKMHLHYKSFFDQDNSSSTNQDYCNG